MDLQDSLLSSSWEMLELSFLNTYSLNKFL